MVRVELDQEEAEWLTTCLAYVMKLARHWDNRTDNDVANRVFNKVYVPQLPAEYPYTEELRVTEAMNADAVRNEPPYDDERTRT